MIIDIVNNFIQSVQDLLVGVGTGLINIFKSQFINDNLDGTWSITPFLQWYFILLVFLFFVVITGLLVRR